MIRKYHTRLSVLTIVVLLAGCATPPSILKIKPSDRTTFYPLLRRQVQRGTFNSYDGTKLSYTYLPNDSARYVAAVIHGIAAHSLLYVPLGDSLVANGGKVYLLDIRGHGESAGNPGDVPGSETLAKDALTFYKAIRRQNPALPIVIIGHSLGTFIWEAALAKYPTLDPAGVVLLAGGMAPGEMSDHLRHLDGHFIYLHPASLFLSWIGFDTRPVEILLPHDSLLAAGHFNTRYTLKFLRGQIFTSAEYDRWLQRTAAFPLLIGVGSDDAIMSIPALKRTFMAAAASDKSFKELPGVTHISIIYESAPVVNDWLRKHFLKQE